MSEEDRKIIRMHSTVIRWLCGVFFSGMCGTFYVGVKLEDARLKQMTIEKDLRIQESITSKHNDALHEHEKQISIINTRLNLPRGKE